MSLKTVPFDPVTPQAALLDALTREVAAGGFARLSRPQMLGLLPPDALASWDAFAESWDDLGADAYMADGGRYRRRRHAAFRLDRSGVHRQPHQPHYQSRDYNPLNGGVQRWFEPVSPATADNPALASLFDICRRVFSLPRDPGDARSIHSEMHQFRISPSRDSEGRPTPEGAHRDGVDWVCVLLAGRSNVAEGVTQIFTPGGASLGEFTLAEPLDAVFLDDRRVLHGVTPIRRIDPSLPGHRDALVLTFRDERSA